MSENLVFSNMLHRPGRTFISVAGIAVGVLLIVFTVGLTNGTLRDRAARESNVGAEIMVRASGSLGLSGSDSLRLPAARAGEIAARVEGVRAAVPIGQNAVAAEDSTSGSRIIEGVPFDDYARIAGLQIVQGRGLAATGDEAIIDAGWQQARNLNLGDRVKIYDRDFTIVGVYEPAAGAARIKIPLVAMQEQLGAENKCSAIIVKIADPAQEEAVAARMNALFEDQQVIPMRELQDLYMNPIPALGVFLNVVIGVASVISALVILLTMYTTVTERTRQIGVLKSLGMSNAAIAWTITQEALLISFLGVVAGILLTLAVRDVVMRTTTMQVSIEWQWLLITLFVGLLGGALGALYPAIRAARLDPVEALSYE